MERKRQVHIPARNARLSEDSYQGARHAVLITIRADYGRPFQDNPELCAATIDLLRLMRGEYGCWIGAYCLMPDHLHFVGGAEMETADIRLLTQGFKGRSTNTSWKYGWNGSLWQRRFHDHVVRAAEELANIEAYILDNPRRASLIGDEEEWEWAGIVDQQV